MEEGEVLRLDGQPIDICSNRVINRVAYHDKLNVILVGTADGNLFVVDPTLGEPVYSTKIGVEEENCEAQWDFSVCPEKLVVIEGNKVGIRSDYNGILLLSSILQTPIAACSDVVQIELSKSEAESLCHSLPTADSVETDVSEVEKQLKAIVVRELEPGTPLILVKREKWSTVKLELPYSVLKSTFQTMVNELWKKNAYIPQLSIASSILERLNMLLPPAKPEQDAPLEKAQMFSESARLRTFSNWPHMEYRWALPEKMAQAGFYHSPSSNGDDRAMCFTCNVCLVSWEPTDEPWSEHERHSPFCPFVRGEHTHNVPLSLSFATAPAFVVAEKGNSSPILGKSSCPAAVVVAYSNGHIVVWDVAREAKPVIRFTITPDVLASTAPQDETVYCDVEGKPKSDVITLDSFIRGTFATIGYSSNQESVNLTAAAVIGAPESLGDTKKSLPPSVVVGGSVCKASTEGKIPFILVYGLSPNTITINDSSSTPPEAPLKTSGRTGTKQENQHFEEDIFSYISDGDMLSDSISIFSDMNMSDTSGTFVVDAAGGIIVGGNQTAVSKKKLSSAQASQALPKGIDNNLKNKTEPQTKEKEIVLVQRIDLPNDLKHCALTRDILPTLDGEQVVLCLESANKQNEVVFGALIVHKVICESEMLKLEKQPIAVRKFISNDEIPVNLCVIPPEFEESALACILRNGALCILKVNDLSLLKKIKRPDSDPRLTSISYVSSLERLCCGTSRGTLEMYTLNSADIDLGDETSFTSDVNDSPKSSLDTTSIGFDASNLIVNQKLTLSSMKQLLQLTSFDNIKPCFTVNVSPCWVRIIQAQKDRKHPQHLQHQDSEVSESTLSWRLQRTKNSKKEHIFEITLPKSARVGHLDLKFSLQPGCVSLPAIEVTLYRALKTKPRLSPSTSDFGSQLKTKAASNEFLKSINAVPVCGPLELGANLDLSGQGGNVVLTSPTLVLNKGRNFYLHIRAKSLARGDSTESTMPGTNVKEGKPDNLKATTSGSNTKVLIGKKTNEDSALKTFKVKSKPHAHTFQNFPKLQGSALTLKFSKEGTPFYELTPFGSQATTSGQPKSGVVGSNDVEGDKRKEYYLGCDWLHEVSVTIRKVKSTPMPLEDHERKQMLTSERLFSRLLDVAVFDGEENSYSAQSTALDLLVWIAAVNLCGPQIGNTSYQVKFIETVKGKLSSLILHGIIFADRSTAHKCAKLLVLCIDAVESYGAEDRGEPFLTVLLKDVLKLLPYTISCNSAGSLQWFFLILNRVRNENLSLASETLLGLLKDVSKELNRRNEPMHSLLRTRFGLYGTPFEQELFEVEVPPFTKSYSHPLTYAGLCASEGANTLGSGTFHLWGLKDVDFRDLLVGNPLNIRWGKIGSLSPKQQIHGLLEVEPLHFTCHAASDGTRVEKIDLGTSTSSFSAVPLPQPWEPFTNLPTGEGSKKSEPDKVDQIMMLQKALKMDSADAYYDVLSDLKFMGNNVNMLELPYSNAPDGDVVHIPTIDPSTWKNAAAAGVLTMVMQPLLDVSSNPTSSSSNMMYNSFIPPPPPPLNPHIGMSSAFLHKTSTSPMGPAASGLIDALISSNAAKTTPSATVTQSSAAAAAGSSNETSSKAGQQEPGVKMENDGLRLLLSPWQQMMYVPPQQALVIDRMHSGARRFVVLDFGAPVLLTDMIIPACSDLVSLSIDIWLHREDTDGQRLVVASDIGSRSLVICDLQPPPVCRYLKLTTIGRYGMGTTKCRIPLGMFYGHSTILPSDLRATEGNMPADVAVLSPTNVQAHLSVLSYLVEDIGCRYQLACTKLRRLLEPLMKPDISPLDHMSYYLPKGKERNKLGLNTSSDQAVLSSYQECITLQQQLNVATNVMKRLQKCMSQMPSFDVQMNPQKTLPEICTDKVHVLTEFLIESLLGISFLASSSSLSTTPIPYSLYTNMTLETCEALFKEICVLENGQCQLSLCTLMLRVCGCQPWWGKFLASTIKSLFCSNQNSIFPQDRVFILLVYLGQKSLLSAQNTSVLENAMELLAELLSPIEDHNSFLRSKIDMTLLGWVVMYLCLCLDGVNCTLTSANQSSTGAVTNKNKDKDVTCVSSRWDFIQGESALYRKTNGSSRMSGNGGFKRRIQKKLMATKQKLEELDNVAAGLGYATQMQTLGGLGNKLSALGNQIEAIKQKQASLGKTIKIQGSKHFKDLIQIRRNELLSKRGLLSGKDIKEDCGAQQDVEINLSLNQSLCLTVAKGLGSLLLRMDSTCHSDVYLIVSKALAKIATCCRPSIPLGAMFEVDQLVTLICGSCGSDYVRERNWSSSWVSHATMCLIQDVLEGEKLYPLRRDDVIINTGDTGIVDDIMSSVEDDAQAQQVEDMCVDSVDGDAVNEILGDVATMESTVSLDSEDSDFEDIEVIEFGMLSDAKCPGANGSAKRSTGLPKKLSPCTTSISSALDARLESGVESTTEIRLRMMSVVDSEVLAQCLKAPVEVPPEILKNMPPAKKRTLQDPISYSVAPSQQLLAACFDNIFNMMASENCSLNIAKVLQLWITINTEYPTAEETHNVKPVIPLSCKSLSSLMSALTKNASVGIQEWGLAFQCLSLAANQRTLNSTTGHWLYIMTDKCFPEIILKFISGSGLNIQKNHVVSAGPTVCQHFYNFLLRLRQLSNDTVWTPCLKEVLLRVLGVFLSGPFLNSDFPLDAFNKFLDRVTCPDLSYENPTTIVCIIQSFASALHRFVFFPSKLNIRSAAELKAGTGGVGSVMAGTSLETKTGRGQTVDMIMFRLVTFMASIVSLPYKKFTDNGMEVHEFLKNMTIASSFKEYESKLSECVAKCETTAPRTIADIVLQLEPAMMRILSVLAHPNGINVLVSGDLSSAFNILDTAAPSTVVDAVIHLFSKLHANCSQPEWMIRPVCRFLSTSPYDDFYCPLMVSETFVLMVLKVISKEDYLKVFTGMKCVEAVCEKLVNSTRKFINSCPTFVSILTQYIGRTDANALFGQKKYSGESLELQDGLINVAPLGAITSTNFSAHPSEVLLQATPPHRRARTPVWSYHFFPEESYLELVVTLPCAVLLKEVQIVPHMTSLSTACPSAVMVEVSRERSNMTLPMGPPVPCGGLSNISIQLTQPEVAQTVLLRLFKPKDSNNLGLSQIRLLGSTTFSEAALQGLSSGDNSRSLESSAHWMYILDRAINTAEGNPVLYRQIIETAVTIPEMLECCYSALVAPIASGKTHDVSLSHVASVLFHFGKYHKDVSEQIISALIGPVQLGLSHGMSANANTQGSNGQSQLNTVVELLYKLCCAIPEWGHVNLLAVIRWLENCADEALSNAHSFRASGAVPEYIQAVSAALWSVAAAGKVDLTNIATPYLLKKLYNWSLKLEPKSELKSIVDHMICSVCFCQPWLFVYLMHSMNLIKVAEGIDLTGSCFADLLQQWYDEGSVWGRVEARDVQSLKEDLHPSVLLTLGRAAQSPAASNNLKSSNLLDTLNVAIMDFWNFYNASAWMGGTSVNAEELPKIITPVQFVGILTFYGELCKVNDFKNWFGTNGAGFWLPLLNLLSTLPGSLKSSYFGTYVYDIESTVINFLAKCCWTHPENQKKIASCLREIILKQKATPHKAVFLHSMSSFCRRLLIQLLLENEKIVVHIKSECKYPLKVPGSTLPFKDRHPCMGVNGCDRVFFAGTQASAYEMLRLIEPIGMKLDKAGNASEATRPSAANKRDGLVEAGLEMIDQIFGTVAKDKRVAADQKRLIKTASKKLKPDSVSENKSVSEPTDPKKGPKLVLELEEFPEVKVPLQLPLNTVLAAVQSRLPFLDVLVFSLRTELSGTSSGELSPSSSSQSMAETDDSGQGSSKEKRTRRIPDIFNVSPVPATIEVFSRMGGLGLLAKHLPVVYPDTLRQIAVGTKFTGSVGVVMSMDKDSPIMHNDADWVKIESADDFYDDMMESIVASSTPIPKKNAAFRHFSPTTGIPPHSMAAFGLFLSLPRFSEVLLGERVGAQCMLRLVMGVTDDADGNDIFGTAVAKTLPTLPFQVLRCLLEILPLSTEEGRHLRRAMVEYKAIHFILACLAVFTHQTCDPSLVPGLQHELVIAATKAQGGYEKNNKSDDKSHVYWAKGTGFGTGSTAQSWDVELALQKKKAEEENVTCLLHVLSSYINPQANKSPDDGKAMDLSPSNSSEEDMNLPPEMAMLLKNSCLFQAISGYLRNDSVLDMARHVPLYKAVLQFLRSLVSSCQLLPLLAPWEKKASSSDDQSISALLVKMKDVVDNYARRLTVNTKGKTKGSKQSTKIEDLEDEGLALLIPDIQSTALLVEKAVNELIKKQGPQDVEMGEDGGDGALAGPPKTLEERYIEEIKKLQFAFYEMITEEEETGGIRFVVPYHYESNVRTNWGRTFPARLKRLAQESVTLSSSLPIAYGSTIFIRCDNDRLDVMKVLITGPSGTPYSNGCFEFDVFFPNDYPSSPMMINLETTGRQRIRFNPNLYTDGKVCLSILNTWHGRPEEKWNPQTSSLLPVLVAIQSLILNAEPYFNEPGYEKSRGTDAGERSSREYNAGIQIATVEWAMLDQLRNPSPCFKEIVQKHFWMKKGEILSQCEKWLEDLAVTCKTDKRAGKNVTGGADPVAVFKNNLTMLKKELMNLKPPEGLEDLADRAPRKSPSDEAVATASVTASSSPSASASGSSSSIFVPSSRSSGVAATVSISEIKSDLSNVGQNNLTGPSLTPSATLMKPPNNQKLEFVDALDAVTVTVVEAVEAGDPMDEDDKVPMDI